MADLETAKQQARQQREFIESQKSELERARESIEQAKAKVPKITKQTLRQGGIQQRLQRRQIKEAQRQVSGQLESVGEYESELKKYEESVAKTESQIRNVEEEKRAYELAKKHYENRISPYWIEDKKVKNYLQELYKQRKMAKEYLLREEAKFEAANPTEDIQIDWKNLKFKSVKSGALGKEIPIREYNKQVEEFNKRILEMQKQAPQISQAVVSAPETAPRATTQFYSPLNMNLVDPLAVQVGKKVLSPVLKFARGEYEWQKKIAPESTKQVEKYESYVEQTPLKKLISKGQLPSAVLKSFYIGGEKYIEGTEYLRTDILGFKPITETEKKQLGKATGTIAMGLFFSPLFETGAATKQKQIQKQLSESKFSKLGEELKKGEKIDVDEIIKKLRYKREGKIIRDKTFIEKLDDVRDIFTRAKAIKDPVVREKSFNEILKILKESYGKEGAEKVIREYLSQEGVFIPDKLVGIRDIREPTGIIKTKDFWQIAVQSSKVKDLFIVPPTMKGAGALVSFASLLGLAKQKQIPKQEEKQKQEQVQIPKPLQKLSLISAQVTAQQQKQEQVQITKQKFKPLEVSTTAFSIPSPVSGASVLPETQLKKKPEPQREKFKLWLKSTEEPKKEIKIAAKEIMKDFDIFVRRKGKDIKVEEAPSLKLATKKLKLELKSTLGASGFVEEEGRKVKLDLGFEFQPSKIDPLRIVQKRQFRLETFGERREIQRARRKASPKINFLGTQAKKQRRISWI